MTQGFVSRLPDERITPSIRRPINDEAH